MPPTPHKLPSSPASLPSLGVTPISGVTPSKRRRNRIKVTNGVTNANNHKFLHKVTRRKHKNKCNQLDLPVVPDKPEVVAVTLRSSQADTRCSRYDMRE